MLKSADTFVIIDESVACNYTDNVQGYPTVVISCHRLRRSSVHRASLFASTCLFSGFFLAASSASAQTTWINSNNSYNNGNWTTGNNWSSGIPPMGGNVGIDQNGTAIINSGTNVSLNYLGIGTTVLGGQLYVNGGSLYAWNLGVGIVPGSGAGILTVNNNGAVQTGEYLNIGARGHGILVLNSGTVRPGTNYSVRIGEQTGSMGEVIVNGGILHGSIGLDNFVVGRSGTGRLEVNNSGKVLSTWAFVGGEYRGDQLPPHRVVQELLNSMITA